MQDPNDATSAGQGRGWVSWRGKGRGRAGDTEEGDMLVRLLVRYVASP